MLFFGRTILVSLTLLLLNGCATNPQAVKDQQRIDAQAAIDRVSQQADAALEKARKDLAIANALAEKTQHLDARVNAYPVGNVADAFREQALQFRSASLQYTQLATTANYIANNHFDPAEQTKWRTRATEYGHKAKALLQLMHRAADLSAHPEKIIVELQPAIP